jgi:hypothetical protein
MGDQAKIYYILNVSPKNFNNATFQDVFCGSNEAEAVIIRSTVSLSEFSAVIFRYHGTNLSGQHTMVSFQKTVENGQSLLLSFAPVNFPKNGFLPSTFRRPFIFAYGSTLIGRLKMFLVRFPMRAGSKKIDFFQNVPGSIPNCGGIDQIVFSKCSWFDSQLRHRWLNREHLVEVKSLKVSS